MRERKRGGGAGDVGRVHHRGRGKAGVGTPLDAKSKQGGVHRPSSPCNACCGELAPLDMDRTPRVPLAFVVSGSGAEAQERRRCVPVAPARDGEGEGGRSEEGGYRERREAFFLLVIFLFHLIFLFSLYFDRVEGINRWERVHR